MAFFLEPRSNHVPKHYYYYYTSGKYVSPYIKFYIHIVLYYMLKYTSYVLWCKVKQSLYRPGQALRDPRSWVSQISRQQARESSGKVFSLTHRAPSPPTPETIPDTHFCSEAESFQDHGAAGRIKSMKISSDTIGNRTRDFPACIVEPQLTQVNATRIMVYSLILYNVASFLRDFDFNWN